MKRINLELNLPDDLAQRAEDEGLLTAAAFEAFLEEETRRRALDRFLSAAERLKALGDVPMTQEEVQAEIDADRAEQRQRRESRC
ncbi:MAG: hypothetical protein O3A46_03190 [Candidatus Poribacteria bacterium]|nr:hypothetical protein [Candidatus Poribacteria bacterium]